jgi:cytochrome c peroxidase
LFTAGLLQRAFIMNMKSVVPIHAVGKSTKRQLAILLCVLCASSIAAAQGNNGDRGVVPELFDLIIPAENPITEEKRVLGKILFWDEQLSSDNTISCGTCHIATEGGGDPRVGDHPGFDNIFNTPDDASGSPGVIAMDSNEEYAESPLFKHGPQSGNRVSFSNLMSPYAFNLFWDGRAEGAFHDPLTNDLVIQTAGMLEIQALGPILNSIEMAHTGRNWEEVTSKLERSRPLALASDVPPDMLAVISNSESYADLFESAFGDPAITPVRVAMAIATYERTTIPNQTPYDQFAAGDQAALTAQQIQGLTAYSNSLCFFCHPAPLFTNNNFHSDGVRPPFEDLGRGGFSSNFGDRGHFRSPSLRNIGLRDRMMHTGTFTSLEQVFDLYGRTNGFMPFFDNLDPILGFGPITFSASDEIAIIDFLSNGLTDPRAAAGTFPFDRPQLYSENTDANPYIVQNTGRAGTGGFTPEPIAVTPPLIGSEEFKVGVKNGLGGATAWVMYSWTDSIVDGELVDGELLGPYALLGAGDGNGYATMKYPLPDDPRYGSTSKFFQWRIEDPNAAGGVALSPVVGVDLFCSSRAPCPEFCLADFTMNNAVDIFDALAFVKLYNTNDGLADLNQDGTLSVFDVLDFVEAYSEGCSN